MSSESQFYADTQTMFDEFLRDMPSTATFLGDHRYDRLLGDFTQAEWDSQKTRYAQWLEHFVAYDPQGWQPAAQIDLTLTVQLLKNVMRGFEKFQGIYRNPGGAVDECLGGVYALVIRDFAPLPERMKSILGRLREVPRVLSEARATIIPEQVPPVWAQVALESARQGIGLLAGFIPMLAQATPKLQEEVNTAAQTAAAALQEYADWIEQTILPAAKGEFAVGRELFDEILREDHMVSYDSRALLATGWRLLEDTERQMQEVAKQIDPNKTVAAILEESKNNHPTADGLLDAYRQNMADARQFVIDHQIATIPSGESIRIEPTPEFMRPIIPYAAYNMPGFLEPVQEGVFIVTPVDAQADPEAAEKKLRGHPWADIPVTALHEAYPGHHLQLVVSNQTSTLPRKFGAWLSSLFVEGWAFYCEELMEQLGFISQPIQKLARLQAQQWRAARIILDVSLHVKQMGIEEAIDFLVQRAGLEPDDAKAEVRRYTMSPTQPQCYLMGKMQILDIVADYKRSFPQAGMRQMHDAILASGSLPPRLMRMNLFDTA